ncbi:hypothetical protein CTAYLR_000259 [Chrysophaeum taylorii]|uniref:Uncharacterized protein n=1 Tax=Chrysophaeum taylorii TaxID=2483200 RepID=A0AAD7UF27_9STRA|nr:hypothetical protein CTAYLR_000259 [Chrysophaeum taylorii]
MWSVEKSYALYGETISEETLSYFRRCQRVLVGICVLGMILQIIQAPGPVALEFVAAFVYLLYNIAAMVIVRITNISFKFEDTRCLWITIRISSVMAAYGVIVLLTVSTFQSNTTLTMMGIFGLINALIILPTNFYEDAMMLRARSDNVGLNKSEPLNACENCIVVSYLVFANLLIALMFFLLIVVFATGGNNKLWGLLSALYVVMNLIPAALPKVEHLVSTETRTWPLKGLLVHFAGVVVTIILTAVALGTQKTTRKVKVLFGAIGVINGIVASVFLVVTASRTLCKPRTAAVELTKDAKEGATRDYEEQEE